MDYFDTIMPRIKQQWKYAREKHPAFPSAIFGEGDDTGKVLTAVQKRLQSLREINDRDLAGKNAITILQEEIYEGIDAYMRGEIENALYEFTQVAAVAVRIINALDNLRINQNQNEDRLL